MNRAGFGVPALAGCAPSVGRDRLKPGLRTSSWVDWTPFLAPIGTMNHEGKTSNIEHRTSNSEDPLGVKPFGVRGSRFKVRSSRFMESPHPLASVNRNHEPRRVWSPGFSRLRSLSRTRPAKAGTPNKFMGRGDAISGAHWDHEPRRENIEHRTSNIEFRRPPRRETVRRSRFEVQGSKFEVHGEPAPSCERES